MCTIVLYVAAPCFALTGQGRQTLSFLFFWFDTRVLTDTQKLG